MADKIVVPFPVCILETAKGGNGERSKEDGIRWHPLIIKWCLYLLYQSSKLYEESSILALPSQRTLSVYSHAVNTGAGF